MTARQPGLYKIRTHYDANATKKKSPCLALFLYFFYTTKHHHLQPRSCNTAEIIDIKPLESTSATHRNRHPS